MPLRHPKTCMQFNFRIPNGAYQTLTVLVVAVILLWSIGAGWSNGRKLAASEQVITNADQLTRGFEYFYNDQDRYPTALEFGSEAIMSMYFKTFPPAVLAGGSCTESFSYKRNSANEYLLGFCLPAAAGGYQQGWNQLAQSR